MARYILDDNFIRLNESYGTLENISDFEAQIYTSATRDEGMILYPHQRISFNKPLYAARARGESGYPVLATMPYMGGDVIGGGVMLEDDNCGCGGGNANFDISIVTNNCGCCTSETITVPAIIDSDCKCECTCTSEVSVVPVPVTLPTSCECCCEGGQVTTIPTSTTIKRSGTYNVSIPIVINVNGGCGCNCSANSDSTTKNDNITDTLEGYFDDKETVEGGGGGSIIETLQGYFDDKASVGGGSDSSGATGSNDIDGGSIIGRLNNYFSGKGD